MTDREILERAATILREHDFVPLAKELQRFIEVFHVDDPPQPKEREVRIAVAISSADRRAICMEDDDHDGDVMACAHEMIVGPITFESIVVATISPRAIPVVKGKVETP
jgi:hypothetical protein